MREKKRGEETRGQEGGIVVPECSNSTDETPHKKGRQLGVYAGTLASAHCFSSILHCRNDCSPHWTLFIPGQKNNNLCRPDREEYPSKHASKQVSEDEGRPSIPSKKVQEKRREMRAERYLRANNNNKHNTTTIKTTTTTTTAKKGGDR